MNDEHANMYAIWCRCPQVTPNVANLTENQAVHSHPATANQCELGILHPVLEVPGILHVWGFLDWGWNSGGVGKPLQPAATSWGHHIHSQLSLFVRVTPDMEQEGCVNHSHQTYLWISMCFYLSPFNHTLSLPSQAVTAYQLKRAEKIIFFSKTKAIQCDTYSSKGNRH